MLNSILKQLNGHGTEAESLQAALVQLGRDRDATRAEIAELNGRRHQLLLDDASDADLDKIERQIDRATVRLEKFNVAEAPLRERIAAAQGVAKQKAVARHIEAMSGAYAILRSAVLAAEEAQVSLMRTRETAIGEVGEHAINRFPFFAFGGLLGRGAAQPWVDANDAVLHAAREARVVKPAVSKAPMAVNSSKAVTRRRTQESAAPRLSAPRVPDDSDALGPDEARVRVLRGGFSPSDDRPQASAGQVVRMRREAAERAARLGAVEILQKEI